MKQNSAIGASVPVVDPVVELIGWIAIRRDSLKSRLLDIVQMDLHPGKGYSRPFVQPWPARKESQQAWPGQTLQILHRWVAGDTQEAEGKEPGQERVAGRFH